MAENRQTTEVKRGASIDELAKRMVSIENTDDDLARMLAGNWQNIVWCVILGAVALVVFREFQATRLKKAGEIAQRFTEVQTDIRKSFQAKEPAAPSPAIQENLKLLTTSYSDDVYGRLARVYQAALLRKEKKFDEARTALSAFPVQALYSQTRPGTAESVLKSDPLIELAALQLARISLDEGKLPVAEIRKNLAGLAHASRFVTGEALLALFRLAGTPEEKGEAMNVAKAVLDSRGALRGKLAEQLAQEDIIIDGNAVLVDASDAALGGVPEGAAGDDVSN